jgi:hypothetical protein
MELVQNAQRTGITLIYSDIDLFAGSAEGKCCCFSASDGERPGHPQITSAQNYVTGQMVYKRQYAERWTQCFVSCVFVDHRVQLARNFLLRFGWRGVGGQIT